MMGRNILFSGLDAKERDIIIDAMEPKDFPEVIPVFMPCLRGAPLPSLACTVVFQGATIIKQGDVGDFFYVVESGFCEIFVDGVGKVCISCCSNFGQHAA